MAAPFWPEPADDPPEERGENLDGHLLPDLAHLRAMPRADRLILVALVADWIGPRVEAFRARVRSLP